MAPSTPPPPSSERFGGVDDRVDLQGVDVGADRAQQDGHGTSASG